MIEPNKERYLGDGLYASHDGYQIKLRAPHGYGPDMEVFLEPGVVNEFNRFVKDMNSPDKKEP